VDVTPAYRDPVVGDLVRTGGYWRGTIGLAPRPACHCIWPTPDPSHLGLASELGARHAALRPAIERALLEHYEPYSEAADAGVPRLELPEHVWRHVAPVRVQIEPPGASERSRPPIGRTGTVGARSRAGR
jgi:hypothetical protein